MGALATVAGLAAAEPEAEAEASIGPGYGYLYYPYYYGHGYAPLKPPSIENIDYGKTGIKYLRKRSADAETDAGIKREAEPMDEGAGPAAGLYPYYGYYNRGYYPYGYRYGYPYRYLGKRDTAEAASGPNPCK